MIEPEGSKYAHFLYDICKYLCYGIESAGYSCCILRNRLASDRVNVLMGAHNLTDPTIAETIKKTGPYILLQSEIITGDTINHWPHQKAFQDIYLPLMREASAVWTGVQANVEALKNLEIEADLLLTGYHPLMEEIHHKTDKDIDFLFCGSITPHRKKLLDELRARGGNVFTMFDDAAMYRNDLIARAKINLAPNQGPGMNHFGGSRVLYLLNNRSLVVVERCFDQAMYEHCFPWAETEHWVDLCLATLNRPDLKQITEEYYQRFKEIRMVDLISPLIEKYIAKNAAKKTSGTTISPPQEVGTFSQKPAVASPSAMEQYSPGLTSIIIPLSDRPEQIEKCLQSLHGHTPEPHEILLVANASAGLLSKRLKKWIALNPSVRLIDHGDSAGIAQKWNLAIQNARGEYFLLLDDDVIVGPGWLSGLLDALKQADRAGLIGPLSNHGKKSQITVDGGGLPIHQFEKYAAQLKEKYAHRRIPKRDLDAFCLLFSRQLVLNIGLFDEQFFERDIAVEDYGWRCALEGFQNAIAADVFVYRRRQHRSSGNRKSLVEKWTLSAATDDGKKLAVVKAVESANLLHQKGSLEEAVQTLVDGIKWSPDAGPIYEELARMLIESKKFSDALGVVQTMPDTLRKSLKGLIYTAYAQEGLNLDDDAKATAEMILSMKENHPAALNLLGILAYKKGENDRAGDYFLQAVHVHPGYAEAHTNLGVLHWRREEKDEALAEMRKGFVLSPSVPDLGALYFSAAVSLGKLSDAEQDFLDALRFHPENKNLIFLTIDLLIKQGKYREAMLRIQDALALFGLEEGALAAALDIRRRIGPPQIDRKTKKHPLSLCMIVKNEEKNLVKCLHSVRDLVDEIIVVDTGSTDRTKDIARIFGAKTFDFPWSGDFAAARNHSLAQATGDWVLVLDADEIIAPRDFDEIRTLAQRNPAKPQAYSIVTRNYTSNVSVIGWTPNTGEFPEEAGAGWVKSLKVRLFPRRADIRFTNPVHELLEPSLAKAKIPILQSRVIVHHYGKLDLEREARKGQDYYLIGKMKYESDPENVVHISELAKQAHLLKKYDEAKTLWLKLLSLIDDPQSEAYRKIASLSFGDPMSEIHIQLASACLLMGQFDEALQWSAKAVAAKTRRKEFTHIYAHCELVAGSPDKAYDALVSLLDASPDYTPALFLMAVVHHLRGDDVKTDEKLRALQNKRVDIPPLFNQMARQFLARGKTREAAQLIRLAAERHLADQETLSLYDEIVGKREA